MRSFIAALACVALVLISSLVSAAVVELTTANYNEVTGQKDKLVFTMVYATWCGHCNSLKPGYEAVSQTFADNDKVVIAKLDAPANEDFARNTLQIKSFPTLWLYKNGQRLDYSGARSQQGIEEFIKSNL
jgi:protein disulfide-isomerase-like protein